MHSNTRRLYLFLSIISFFSIALYTFRFGLAGPKTKVLKLQNSLPKWTAKENYAYATFLGPPTSKYINSKNSTTHTNSTVSQLKDPYFISVRLLNYQIIHAEKTRTTLRDVPFLVLALPEVPKAQLAVLEAEGATIVPIEPLDLPDAFDKNFIENSRFRDVLSKLRLWQLVGYDKILYLDADSFLLENLDEIFVEPQLSAVVKSSLANDAEELKMPDKYLMAASSDTYGDQTPWEEDPENNPAYLCACFMLLQPSNQLFNYYTSTLTGPNAPPNAAYPEQDLLIYVHRKDGPMPWKRIPISWSANDGEMNDELALLGGVKSLHVKGWEGSEGGNVANEKYKNIWKRLVEEMEGFYAQRREHSA